MCHLDVTGGGERLCADGHCEALLSFHFHVALIVSIKYGSGGGGRGLSDGLVIPH